MKSGTWRAREDVPGAELRKRRRVTYETEVESGARAALVCWRIAENEPQTAQRCRRKRDKTKKKRD